MPAPSGVDFDRRPLVCADGDVGCYWRSDTGNKLLIGGLEPACDQLEWADADDWNRELTEQWTAQVYRAALRIPTLPIPQQAQGIAALYDVSDDWIPIYDRAGLPGFYMAVGTSGNQFKNAPLAGVLMAELILACEAGRDHDRDPLQGQVGRYTGLEIDLGFFSRLRAGQPGEQLLGARLSSGGYDAGRRLARLWAHQGWRRHLAHGWLRQARSLSAEIEAPAAGALPSNTMMPSRS